jgi:hypothetical protein
MTVCTDAVTFNRGRKITELSFNSTLNIGGYQAHDYFGDGSFYLLNTPGVSGTLYIGVIVLMTHNHSILPGTSAPSHA